jgi:hypothetical protein
MAGRSLTADRPCEAQVSHVGEARNYASKRRVAAGGATRSGGRGPHDRPPPEEPSTQGFRINISIPIMFSGAATRSACLTSPPIVGTDYRHAALGSVPRVIETTHCSYMLPFDIRSHRGRVRTDTTRSNMYLKPHGKGPGDVRKTLAWRRFGLVFSPAPEGGRKTRLGGELHREEQRLSRTRGAWIETGPSTTLAMGVSLAFPPNSSTTGVAQEHDQFGPTRLAHASQLG